MVRSRDSRNLILDAAREEFGAHGLAGGRVARIARRAKVNKQLIFYYFGSKEGLHCAVTSEAAVLPPVQDGSARPATEELRRAVSGIFVGLGQQPALVAAAVQPPGSGSSGAGAVLARLEADLAALIAHGQGLGYFRDDADPALVARQAVVLCVGFHAMRPRLAPVGDWAAEVAETLARRLAW